MVKDNGFWLILTCVTVIMAVALVAIFILYRVLHGWMMKRHEKKRSFRDWRSKRNWIRSMFISLGDITNRSGNSSIGYDGSGNIHLSKKNTLIIIHIDTRRCTYEFDDPDHGKVTAPLELLYDFLADWVKKNNPKIE